MKALSLFSSPSSCNGSCSRNRTTAGCVPRILRRILCFSSLSTCPFDYLKEDDQEKLDSSMVGSSGTTPGIVAKLMGLESLPLIEESPSANSTDYLFKKPKSPRVRRRMIIPFTYQEVEDDNFFIFSFESQLEPRKSSKNYERMEQPMGAKRKKKGMMRRSDSMRERDDRENMVSKGGLLDSLQVENGRNVLRPWNNSCQKNMRKKQEKISCETEGHDSENSSPNSVLEFVEFPTDHQQASCSGNATRLGNSRMRRTLCEELDKCETSKEKRLLMNNIGFGKQNVVYGGKWDEIGMEVMKLSWVQDEIFRNQNHFKEIGRDIATQILGQLLDEMLSNLNHF